METYFPCFINGFRISGLRWKISFCESAQDADPKSVNRQFPILKPEKKFHHRHPWPDAVLRLCDTID
jgi:hypothetical protein